MRRLFNFLADVFLADGDGIPAPSPRDLTDAYRAEIPGFAGDRVLVLYGWETPVQKALHAYKYAGARGVGAALAKALAKEFLPRGFAEKPVVTWIPGRFFQYLLRGYNPSRALAAAYARAAGLPAAGLLVKTRATARQASLGREGRLANLQGAFRAVSRRTAAIRGADVVVVDDVVTTGSTFHEAAQVLKAAGARSVTGIFVASSTR